MDREPRGLWAELRSPEHRRALLAFAVVSCVCTAVVAVGFRPATLGQVLDPLSPPPFGLGWGMEEDESSLQAVRSGLVLRPEPTVTQGSAAGAPETRSPLTKASQAAPAGGSGPGVVGDGAFVVAPGQTEAAGAETSVGAGSEGGPASSTGSGAGAVGPDRSTGAAGGVRPGNGAAQPGPGHGGTPPGQDRDLSHPGAPGGGQQGQKGRDHARSPDRGAPRPGAGPADRDHPGRGTARGRR